MRRASVRAFVRSFRARTRINTRVVLRIGGAAAQKHARGRYLFASRLENFLADRLLAIANHREPDIISDR